MGRANRVRKNRETKKADPLGSVRNLDIGQHAAIREAKILPVVKNISSLEANERIEAVTAVAHLVEDQTCRKLLLKERIVTVLMEQALNDSAPEVIVKGWGALRNLAVEEGYDVCIHMYRKDILTPISAAIDKIHKTISFLLSDPNSVDSVAKKLVWTYAENVVGLLTSLCSEGTEEIVNAVNKLNPLPFLMGLLSPECKTPRTTQNIAAQSLNVLTEEQDELIQSIVESGDVFLPLLLKLRDTMPVGPAASLLRTVAICGVMHNISDFVRASENKNSALSDAVNLTKVTALIDAATKILPPTNGNVPTTEEPITEEERCDAIQTGLETLSSIIASLQEEIDGNISKSTAGMDDMMDEDFEDDEKDEEAVEEIDDSADDEAMQDDIAMVTAGDRDSSEEPTDSADQSPTFHLINVAIPLLLPLCNPQDTTPRSTTIQIRALNCLNNISWTAATTLPHSSSLFKIFEKQAPLIWSSLIVPILNSNSADVELAEAVASLSWAIAKTVGGKLSLSEGGEGVIGEHKRFMSLYNAATTDDLRTRCVGVLGCLGLAQGRIEVNKEVGVFLLTILSSLPPTGNTSAEPAIEAVDALFDMYADADFDYDEPVFVKHNFIDHLTAIYPKFKAMTKKIDRRKFPELRERGDEAAVNLRRFIDYKKKERAK
ncbi:hypothetical protein BDZ91DRAFT_731776 [Kalaharituber pfeilii]|nr:hypothetical protein BDZ91DRAFT_731776 [Kalaharituber pfeilii]